MKPALPALDRLAERQDHVRYVIARDHLGEGGARLDSLRRASVGSAFVQGLLSELASWPGEPLSSHRSAEQAFHKLALAVEFGLRRSDPGAEALAERIMENVSEEGPFALPMRQGGEVDSPVAAVGAWALCDAPVILRSLVAMGYGKDPRVLRAIACLEELSLEQAWPCAVSKSLGGWRGPGRKGDICPYASLAMIELLLEALPGQEAAAGLADRLVHGAALALLDLWENSRSLHPYMFYMGTDFRKLKAPLLWYDLLHVLDALSRVPGLEKDPRLLDMAAMLESKGNDEGLFTPESVYQKWRAEDFGQKKLPSAYLSAVALRILRRLED